MSGIWKTVSGFPKEQDHKKVGHTVLTPNTYPIKHAPLKDIETYSNKIWKKQNYVMRQEYSLHPGLA